MTCIVAIWLTTIIIVIPMFSFVQSHPSLFVCFKETCSKGPPAAINAGYVYHYQYYYLSCYRQSKSNTANSKHCYRNEDTIECQRSLALVQVRCGCVYAIHTQDHNSKHTVIQHAMVLNVARYEKTHLPCKITGINIQNYRF